MDAAGVIARLSALARRFHLDETVLASELVLYDGPGDFQLALRSDLFDIGGFEEEMLLGWHVDSNLAARMRLKRGDVLSAKAWLRGYHCKHTRRATVYHAPDAVQNDWQKFVFGVTGVGGWPRSANQNAFSITRSTIATSKQLNPVVTVPQPRGKNGKRLYGVKANAFMLHSNGKRAAKSSRSSKR